MIKFGVISCTPTGRIQGLDWTAKQFNPPSVTGMFTSGHMTMGFPGIRSRDRSPLWQDPMQRGSDTSAPERYGLCSVLAGKPALEGASHRYIDIWTLVLQCPMARVSAYWKDACIFLFTLSAASCIRCNTEGAFSTSVENKAAIRVKAQGIYDRAKQPEVRTPWTTWDML